MKQLKKRIHDDSNGLDYVLVGDYYIPDLKLPEESRPIGRWGRLHKKYLEQYQTARYHDLILSGRLWTYLADLNEQAQARLEVIVQQMKTVENITEDFKRRDWLGWVQAMNIIRNRAEEIIYAEMIYQ